MSLYVCVECVKAFCEDFVFEKQLGIQQALEKIKLDKWGVKIGDETGVSDFGIW